MPIIDTSVVLTALLREPLADQAAAVMAEYDGRMHAPDILTLEIANAAVGAIRNKRLSAEMARAVLNSALVLPIALHPTTPLVPRAFEISLQYHRRPYDGLFLALAEQRRDLFLTTDMRLVNGLIGTALEQWVRAISA